MASPLATLAKRRRSTQTQVGHTPNARAVCGKDKSNNSGNTTACACRNSWAVFALCIASIACGNTSRPLTGLPFMPTSTKHKVM
jgi:hypothetical protein